MGFWNAVKLTQMTFCLAPNILYSVNVIFNEVRAVIDTKMIKFTHIKHIMTSIKIGVNKAVLSRIIGKSVADCVFGTTTV
ncbi:hypothetical protein Mh1962_17550 [Mannheimia haemolytica]